MIVLGIDLETDSTNPETAAVIEIAAVLYDTEAAQPLRIVSALVNASRRFRPLPKHITDITGITEEMLGRYGLLDEQYVQLLCSVRDRMTRGAEALVMHNGAAFDKVILEMELERNRIPDYISKLALIDTMTDLMFPHSVVYKNLTYIAACHGILHSFCHRALSDTFVMLQILQRYDVKEVLEAATSPMVSLRIVEGKKKKELARSYGFSYNLEEGGYIKDVRKAYVDKIIVDLPFEVTVLENE